MSRNKTALISDAHGNTPALRAVLDEIKEQGFDNIYFLGDAVNGLDPGGCLQILRECGAICLKGNAEHMVCTKNIEGFPWHGNPKYEWYGWIVPLTLWWKGKISLDLLDFVEGWHEDLIEDDVYFVHDSPLDRHQEKVVPEDLPPSYARLVFHGDGFPPGHKEKDLQENLTILESEGHRLLFCAHTHEPYIRSYSGKIVCNTGSVGLPLDGDWRSSWISWEGDEITINRTEYDVEEIVTMLHDFDMPGTNKDSYEKMLRQGMHWSVF